MNKFIKSPNYTRGHSSKPRLIVIHTMEAPEGENTAENVANYFAKPTTRASAHLCIDTNSVVQCVSFADSAWAAPPVNGRAFQIEHAGYARQSLSEWQDEYSQAMLQISAREVATLCKKYAIPAKHVTGDAIRYGSGICGHVDVNEVYHQSTHTDPGENFPWTQYINLVNEFLTGKTNKKQKEEEEEMKNCGIYWNEGDKTIFAVFNTLSGFYAAHSGVNGDYNNSLARALDTPAWAQVTKAHADIIRAQCEQIRAKQGA